MACPGLDRTLPTTMLLLLLLIGHAAAEVTLPWLCDFEEMLTDDELGGYHGHASSQSDLNQGIQPCGFTNVDGTSPWRHNKGSTPTSYTGPSEGNSHDIDPTHACYGQGSTCTISGVGDYYMYTEATSNYPGVTLSLESPDIPTVGVADGLLLTFYYSMYEDMSSSYSLGELRIDTSSDGTTFTEGLWSKNGNQGDTWQQALVVLPPDTVRFRFTGETGSSAYSDIAIDDVSLTYGPSVAPTISSMPTGQAVLPYSCDFEGDLCDFEPSEDYPPWEWGVGSTPTSYTGPSVDKTYEDDQGYYMYVEASSPNYPAVEVAMQGPFLPPAGEMSLSFWYHMYGSTMGEFRVDYTYDGQSWTTGLWSQTGNLGDVWNYALVYLPTGSKRFRFVMTTDGYRSDVAVDEILINPGVVSEPTLYPTYSVMPTLNPTDGHCLTVHMWDSYGDGWINHNGGYSSTWTWYFQETDGSLTALKTGGLDGDLTYGTERICFDPDAGCYLFEVTPVSVYDSSLLEFAKEIAWELTMENEDDTIAEADYKDGVTETTAEICPDGWPTAAPTTASPTAAVQCMTLNMFDSFGDGWSTSFYVWEECEFNSALGTWSTCTTVETGTLATGAAATEEICYVPSSCYKFSLSKGGQYSEMSWELISRTDGSMLAQGDCSGTNPDVSCDGEGAYKFCPDIGPTPSPTALPTDENTNAPSLSVQPSVAPSSGEQLCPHIVMTDTYSDGWGTAMFTWQMEGSSVVETGTMEPATTGGLIQTHFFGLNSDGECDIDLEGGVCYTLTVSEDYTGADATEQAASNEEIGWTLFGKGSYMNPNNLLAAADKGGTSHTQCWGTPGPTISAQPTRTKAPSPAPTQSNSVSVDNYYDFRTYATRYGTETCEGELVACGPLTITVTDDIELNAMVIVDSAARLTIIGKKADGSRVKMTPGSDNTGALFRVNANSKVTFKNIDFGGGQGYEAPQGAGLTVTDPPSGGAFYVIEESFLGFSDCSIMGGTADEGGCLWLRDSDLEMNNVDIGNCHAEFRGGAVMFDGDYAGEGNNLMLRNVHVFNNTADDSGGGLRIKAAHLTMTNVEFDGNYALKTGGGIHVDQSSTNITSSVFHHNFAGWKDQLDPNFEQVQDFYGAGGAAFVTSNDCPDVMDQCWTTFNDCVFRDNEAVVSGGAIQPTGEARMNLFGGAYFVNNVAHFDVDDSGDTQSPDIYSQIRVVCPGSSCGLGSYGDCTDILNTACSSCRPDTCIDCPEGKYGTEVNGVDDSGCVFASEGYHVPEAGSATETVCPAGSYAASADEYAEELLGQQDGVGVPFGATHCVACPAGKLTQTEGQTECEVCERGTTSAVGATECADCDAGKYSSTAGSACQDCEVGKYTAETGTIECESCPDTRTTLRTGATTCDACDAGFYLSDHAVCPMATLCPKNKEPCTEEDDCLSIRMESIFNPVWRDFEPECTPDPTGGGGSACCTLPPMVEAYDEGGERLTGITIQNMRLKKVNPGHRVRQKGEDAVEKWLDEHDKKFCSTTPCKEESFWRISPFTIDIWECAQSQACKRGAFDFNNSLPEPGMYQRYEPGCQFGYSGILCENCIEGWFKRNIQADCLPCSDIMIDPQTLLGIAVFTLLGIAILFVYFLPWFQEWFERNQVWLERAMQQFTIIFVTWQIVSSLSSVHEHVGGAGYPDPFREWAEAVEHVINFDLFDLFHPDCWGWDMGVITYESKLKLYTLFPIGLIALGLLIRCVQKFGMGEKNLLGGWAFEWPLVFFYLTLPAVSKVICSAHRCVPFLDGISTEIDDPKSPFPPTSFMLADKTIQCYDAGKMTAQYQDIMTYSIIMFIVLPVGGTLSMFALLWANRLDIQNREYQEGDEHIWFLKIWFQQYDPVYWWYGILDMSRRLFFTSVLMFVNGNDGGRGNQIVLAIIVALCTVLLLRETGPYWDAPLDYLAYWCSWQVVLACVFLLLMDAHSGEPLEVNEMVLTLLLVTVNVCILGTSINFTCGSGQALYENVVDAAEYSQTRNLATGFGTSVPTMAGQSRRRSTVAKGVLGAPGGGDQSERSGRSMRSGRSAKIAPGGSKDEDLAAEDIPQPPTGSLMQSASSVPDSGSPGTEITPVQMVRSIPTNTAVEE